MAKKSTHFTALLIFLCFSTFFLHALSRTTPLNTATATATSAAAGLDNAQSADDDWWGHFPFPPIWPFVPATPSPPAAGHNIPPPPSNGGDDWWGHFPFPPLWPFVPAPPSPPAGAKNPPAPGTNPPPAAPTTPSPPVNRGDDWWGHFPFPPIWPFVPAPPSPPAKEKVVDAAKTSPPAA